MRHKTSDHASELEQSQFDPRPSSETQHDIPSVASATLPFKVLSPSVDGSGDFPIVASHFVPSLLSLFCHYSLLIAHTAELRAVVCVLVDPRSHSFSFHFPSLIYSSLHSF